MEPHGSLQRMEKRLDILHLSLHGLIRGHDLELGRDPDTGGQCLYVLELVKALARHERVERVTLVTRRIFDRKVAADYAVEHEDLGHGAEIRRIEVGPRRYLRKEALWRHLDAFVDGTLAWLKRGKRVPDLIHAHYADAGYVGRQIAAVLGVPFVFTGHSLGRVKRQRLVESGLAREEIDIRYNLGARIEAEELSLDAAAIVCTSTRQEVEDQYALYDQYASDRMRVIPPGLDLTRFDGGGNAEALASVDAKMRRFLNDPAKPPVLAIARADERKNLGGLVRAFGGNDWLREHANLILIGGNRETLDQLPSGGRKVWQELLRLIDDHDLHGVCAYPKRHASAEVPEFYRWAAARGGVFVNPAFTEPFGLTLLEASAAGLPLVATNDGGPRDILENCRNGELVDPMDPAAIGRAIEGILSAPERRNELSRKGAREVREHYSWDRHVARYLREVMPLLPLRVRPTSAGSLIQLARCERWIVMDLPPGIEEEPLDVVERWRELFADGTVGLGFATGLSYGESREVIDRLGMPRPAFVIAGLGAEIRYGDEGVADEVWARQVAAHWRRKEVVGTLADVPGLEMQPEERQHPLKVSYFRAKGGSPSRREIQRLLREAGVAAKVLVTEGCFIDVLPVRSGKDVALRHVIHKWGIDHGSLFYFACYGNDGAVVRGRNLAAIASTADPQVKLFRPRARLWHCKEPGLRGLFEGLDHYRFLEGAPPPPPEDSADDEMPVDELMP